MELSRSLPCIDVRWKTKKPNLGEWFRTPYFHLCGNELCLESAVNRDHNGNDIAIRVVWRYPPSNVNVFYSRCYVNCGNELLYFQDYQRNSTFNDYNRKRISVNPVLHQTVKNSDSPPMDREEDWSVICQLSCDQYFDSEVEKKRIHLTNVADLQTTISRSVDKCVQIVSEIPRNTEAHAHDFACLLKEGIHSDFKLICGGQTFPVHRCVLAIRSVVFRAMFSQQMQESKTGVAVIEDLEVPVLKQLLNFVYSGKLEDISVETASKLYEAADKYAVRSLMKACSYYMIRNMTEENCVSYLKTADFHSDPDLKAVVASFVIQQPSVFKSPAWAVFSGKHPALANEVLQSYIASLKQ